jgi:ribonuclease HII
MLFLRMIQTMVKPIKPIIGLLPHMRNDCMEVGIDEVARGCLAGRVYAAAVIWDSRIQHPLIPEIKDSKKLTPVKRTELRQFIEKNATAWSIGWIDEAIIDQVNIRNATFMAMHQAIENIQNTYPNLTIGHILVDGNAFDPYADIPHTCVIKGDNTYLSIACASILAKTHRDEYIASLARTYPDLHKYGWHKNNAYGTRDHLEAIRIYGISQFHRKTFGICKTALIAHVEPNLTFIDQTPQNTHLQLNETVAKLEPEIKKPKKHRNNAKSIEPKKNAKKRKRAKKPKTT